MPLDYNTFIRGERVAIASEDTLQKYHERHGYAYGITDEQLQYAGREDAMVVNIGFYHGNIVLYQLGPYRHHLQTVEVFPGVWFDDCVSDYDFLIADFDQLPFRLCKMRKKGCTVNFMI